jgi:chromosome partitioning protein
VFHIIVVLAQTKGGVGKTTIAVNLAVARALAGRDLLLVDADEQATASDFTAIRTEQLGSPGYTAIQLSGSAVRTQVLQLAAKYDDVIIDAGGRDTSGLRAALTVADVAVVPFQPRSFDIWTLDKVSDLIIEARSYNPNLRALAVLNFADAQGDDNEAAASALSNAGAIEFLDCPIGRRKAFPNAAAEGRGVVELKRADPKATAELSALTDALFQLQTQTVAE